MKKRCNIIDKILNETNDKKKRILDAAMEEFSKHDYDKASTNRIVEKAGVGKGMLYYYFGNKEELYKFLIDYGITYITEEYLMKIDTDNPDIIERYRQVSRIKMIAYTKDPHIFQFFANVYLTDPKSELEEMLHQKGLDYRKLSFGMLNDNIDFSLFRDDIDHQRALTIFQYTMKGYEDKIVAEMWNKFIEDIDLDPYWEEYDQLLDDLKLLLYK